MAGSHLLRRAEISRRMISSRPGRSGVKWFFGPKMLSSDLRMEHSNDIRYLRGVICQLFLQIKINRYGLTSVTLILPEQMKGSSAFPNRKRCRSMVSPFTTGDLQ